ncbi:HAMP domain-containing sensor histidine kinase [Streptomyces sp. 4R-3d]|uniref:sensor histidine kinase n=1 Tax=Streptomyces sp. 4R-3d TaxID=2559605 RepID=UPI001071BC10|nr:HAMP domain-containing sensor histidine kinase [Streptomyces sp. 4R-3d]TFI29003.1 HAMP domain-containing histidine kinase [Streptomyces sp. 4R-3d]
MRRREPERRRRERGRARLPLRRSLLGRLLIVSVLVASCAVAATAWLAVQTTSGAIRQEQGQDLSSDAKIYNTLLGYAATHPRWEDVEDTARELARTSQRRIVLTTEDRRPLFDSAGASSVAPLPAQASAVVDPLSVDTVLVPDAMTAGSDRIDPRAVGPFLLPANERTELRAITEKQVACLNSVGVAADVVDGPSGRPRIEFVRGDTDRDLEFKCVAQNSGATLTEKKALDELNTLADACLKRQGHKGATLNLDLSWDRGYGQITAAEKQSAEKQSAEKYPSEKYPAEKKAAAVERGDDRAIASCVGSARREQLTDHVAAPALLFIDGTGAVSVPGFDLSPSNTARIVGVTALVLALTVGVSVIAGARLVRPLHALTGAAQRMRDGLDSAPVPVGPDNEIGRLAAAFNDMAVHRARLEEQRKVMVSDVAHELRTPLSNIRGWLEAAQDGLADPDPAFVSSLLEEAVQLQHIIDDLQDLGAADVGALRLHPEPVYADELLGQVAAAYQGQAETAGVTLGVATPKPGPPGPTLYADPVRLRQAVSNLVSNAVRHTPSGGRVTLRSYRTGPGHGDEVALEVSDTGAGIPADDIPHVFDRFWRAEKSRNRSTGGSGLGLAIVLKLAEAQGGTASVVSTEGKGSVFTLRLPPAPAEAPADATAAEAAAGPDGPDPINMTL